MDESLFWILVFRFVERESALLGGFVCLAIGAWLYNKGVWNRKVGPGGSLVVDVTNTGSPLSSATGAEPPKKWAVPRLALTSGGPGVFLLFSVPPSVTAQLIISLSGNRKF